MDDNNADTEAQSFGFMTNRGTAPPHRDHHGIETERFAEEPGESQSRRCLPGVVPCRDAHDRDIPEQGLTLLVLPEFDAIHDWHHQLEQDHRRTAVIQLAQRLAAIHRGHHIEAFLAEKASSMPQTSTSSSTIMAVGMLAFTAAEGPQTAFLLPDTGAVYAHAVGAGAHLLHTVVYR